MSIPHILPPEILLQVFKDLQSLELHSCSQVSQQWRKTVYFHYPLFNPMILETIFQYLNYIQILKVRQVCKFWKLTVDRLTLKGDAIPAATSARMIQLNDVKNMIETLPKNHNPFPTRHLCIKFQCYPRNDLHIPLVVVLNYIQTLHDILKVFGDHLKFLTIIVFRCGDSDSCHNAYLAMKFILFVVHHLRNLKGLSVLSSVDRQDLIMLGPFGDDMLESNCNCFIRSSLDSDSCKNILSEKFDEYTKGVDFKRKLKNIKMLSLYFPLPELARILVRKCSKLEFLDVQYPVGKLPVSRSVQKFENVSSLMLSLYSTTVCKNVKILISAKLSLKWLSLTVCVRGEEIFEFERFPCGIRKYTSSCFTTLHQLLRSYRRTLQTLDLTFDWQTFRNDLDLGLKFPSGKDLFLLETFRLVGFMGQLDFLCDMKTLQRLYLVNNGVQAEDQLVFKDDKTFYKFLPSLKELYRVKSFGRGRGNEVSSDRKFLVGNTYKSVLWNLEKFPMLESEDGEFPFKMTHRRSLEPWDLPCCACVM